MINKELIKNRFKKSLKTYDENALVQKIVAEKLVNLLPYKNFSKIFEIGCGSGILTKIIKSKYNPEIYVANDIVAECEKYITKIFPSAKFIKGDIEKIEIADKFDLIISNAALQWCDDLEKTYEKLQSKLNIGGVLAFSVFGEDNFEEINKILNVSLSYQNIEKLDGIKLFPLPAEVLWFNSPKEVLNHLKLTGVNALKQEVWTKTKLKNFDCEYKKLFCKDGLVSLTYKPVCAIFENLD